MECGECAIPAATGNKTALADSGHDDWEKGRLRSPGREFYCLGAIPRRPCFACLPVPYMQSKAFDGIAEHG